MSHYEYTVTLPSKIKLRKKVVEIFVAAGKYVANTLLISALYDVFIYRFSLKLKKLDRPRPQATRQTHHLLV